MEQGSNPIINQEIRKSINKAYEEGRKTLKSMDSLYKDKDVNCILKEGSYKREILADSVLTCRNVIENLLNAIEDDKNYQSNYVRKDELENIFKSFLPNIKKYVINEINSECQISKQEKDQNVVQTSKSSLSNSKTTQKAKSNNVIIIHNELEEEGTNIGFSNEKWSTVTKKDINNKLKNIPIKNSTTTKSGKVCLFMENEDVMKDAKKALESKYNVEATKSISKKILPKVKLFNIDTSLYNKDSCQQLKADILNKNKYIEDKLINDSDAIFEIIAVNDSHSYAIAKMTEDIRGMIKDNANRLFLNLTSHVVKDNFQPQQCFKCQKFGHKAGSDHCCDIDTCLHCTGNHKSRDCTMKHSLKCANCKSNEEYKSKCEGHRANSQTCPIMIKEKLSLIRRTAGISKEDFLDYKAKFQPES